MAYSTVWDEAQPLGSVSAADIDQLIRDEKRNMRERVAGIFGLNLAQWSADPIVPISLALSTFLAVGASPAQSGPLRLPNNTYVMARNALNTADISAWKVNASNQVEFGAAIAGAAGSFIVQGVGGEAYINMKGVAASGHLNWRIGKSVTVANALEFQYSTVADGMVFTTTAAYITTGGFNGNLLGTILTPAQANITSVGTLTSLIVSGALNMQNDSAISGTKKFYLDGGSDTYVLESSANVIDFYVGAVNNFRVSAIVYAFPGLVVNSLSKVYLDGGGDTYIQEGVANRIDFIAGGVNTFFVSSSDAILRATGKFYLDGGGDTYIFESGPNILDLTVGSFLGLRLNSTGAVAVGSGFSLSVQPTQRVYLDGGSNTYIYESSADVVKIVTGTIDAAIFSSAGIVGNLTGTILTAAQGNITSLGILSGLTADAGGGVTITIRGNNTVGGYYAVYGAGGVTARGFLGNGSSIFAGGALTDFGLASEGGDLVFATSSGTIRARISNSTGVLTSTAGFSGNITGNLTGTVLTASQPNITSHGTLTGLSLNGDITLVAAATKVILGATSLTFRDSTDTVTRMVVGGAAASVDVSVNAGSLKVNTVLDVNGTQILSSRRTGWASPTAGLSRTAVAAADTLATTISHLAALVTDLQAHGVIGA